MGIGAWAVWEFVGGEVDSLWVGHLQVENNPLLLVSAARRVCRNGRVIHIELEISTGNGGFSTIPGDNGRGNPYAI